MRDFGDAKLMAKTLRQALADRGVSVTRSETLEIVARQFGLEQWNILSAKIDAAAAGRSAIGIEPPMPIFRIFSVEKAMEFYCGFLGFTLDWEHRFGDYFPLYCQVSRDDMALHLSEHSGDASPGAKAFVRVANIRAYHAELAGKDYRYMKPGIEEAPWGLEMTVIDPFSNRIAFCEQN
ncbi:VOC family protein [Rhizobium lentis]|uniref:glyoxalase superfamily protein n=1 Tax=Rhizobium lentis TaxID=1138194 RepID=UPI001A936F40|nr:glyoxalase superfamily protein [Rhizobium lentis]MBX5001422.1 VOC family protein [Rhizobium lentis]MBX5019738.1 VOC family protein [Rhizobium lentis]MBX5041021.1 VOC family protein [Rhizobium lentis]MBX5054011.1 VOC family protein [Rhizobium lentis]MBX5065701.1 VOC family protein [Rhizobium lentis]